MADISARISRSRTAIPWRMNPLNFLDHYVNKPVVDLLGKDGTRIVSESKFDGRKVLVIETEPAPRDELLFKGQFLIDCLRNFTVVRKAGMVSYVSEESWHDYAVIEASQYHEVIPGVWLPREVKYESFKVLEGKTPELTERRTIHNDHWSVNDPLPDSLFKLPFPEGVYVTDEVSGREYRNTHVTDQKISDAATAAKELQQTYAGMPSPDEILRGNSRRWWLSVLLVLSGVCTLAGFLFLVRWRKKYTK